MKKHTKQKTREDKERVITLVNAVHPTTLYRNTRMPALSLASIAAYVPSGWKTQVIDETVDDFNAFDAVIGSDIIGISGGNVCNIESVIGMIEQIEEMSQLTGKSPAVVIGGYVASADPAFFGGRADSVIVGPGELAMQNLIKDFEKGELKARYDGARIPLDKLRRPDFKGFNIEKYGKNINWPVMTSVSCNSTCSFCSARTVFGDGYEAASAEKVLDLISRVPKGERIYFVDPNIVSMTPEGVERAKKIFKRMTLNPHPWYGAVSFGISKQDEVLQLMKESGCYGLLIGFDSVSPQTIKEMKGGKYDLTIKDQPTMIDGFVKGTRKIQEKYGIEVLGTFVTGFDGDTPATFDNTIRLIQDSGMKDAQCMPLTPLPGTKLYDLMESQNRIFDHDFSHYDFTEVVFRPMNFRPQALRSQLARVYDTCFPRMAKLYRRLGLLRDRPEEIKIKSVREDIEERDRREKERQEADRRRQTDRGHD